MFLNFFTKVELYEYLQNKTHYQKIEELKKIQNKLDAAKTITQEYIDATMRVKVKVLQSKKQIQQLSKEWFDTRKTMFTASSDIYGLLGKSYQYTINKKKKKNQVKPFRGNKYTQHGTKYEKIGIQIYESRYNKQVHALGLLQHSTITCLGASPDGITSDGRLLEIKVPSKRIINGEISKQYYTQMQTQLEVCDLDVCDFFECKITEYADKQDFESDQYEKSMDFLNNIIPITTDTSIIKVPHDRRTKIGLEKGMIGRIGYYAVSNTHQYIYPPMHFTSLQQFQWLKEKQRNFQENNIDMHIDYWKLEYTSYNQVFRSKEWWQENNVTNVVETAFKLID
jgi:putative phage-type endonuclease